jgi:hypothetical protein
MLRVIVGLRNVRDALVERTLDDGFWRARLRVGRGEAEFERVVFQIIANPVGHLHCQLWSLDRFEPKKTYNIIHHLLTQHQVKVLYASWVVLESRFELDQNAVLQEVVVLRDGRVEILRFEIGHSAVSFRPRYYRMANSLLLRLLNLESNHISILNFILQERRLGSHCFDHTRLDLLQRISSAQGHQETDDPPRTV